VVKGTGLFDHPSWAPDGRRLVYAYDPSPASKWHIYIVTVASGAVKQVTFGNFTDWYPSWSPNGQTIAFTSDRSGQDGIWVIDLGALSAKEMASGAWNDEEESWAPDGGRLVYSSDRIQHRWQLFAYDFSTGLERQVIRSDTMDRFPVYSPDGRFILVSTGYPAVYSSSGGKLPGGGDRWKLSSALALDSTWSAADLAGTVTAVASAIAPAPAQPATSTAGSDQSAASAAGSDQSAPTTAGTGSGGGPPDTGLPPSAFPGAP
jgi:Tol biopolymer transport system component